MRHVLRSAVGSAAFVSATLSGRLGAQAVAGPASPTVEVLTVDLRRFPDVLLRMRAKDASGRFIAGLSQGDVSLKLLRDTLAIARIRTTSAADARPFVQLVLDVSGSMRPALAQLRAAAREFAERLGPSVPIGIVLAGDTAEVKLPVNARLDSVLAALPTKALAKRTALWDAVRLAVQAGADSLPGRRYVLVLTDGRDNASSISRDSLIAIVRQAATPIYTVAFGSAADTAVLQHVAVAAGGESTVARTGSLTAVLSAIGASIAAEHLVETTIPPSAIAGWDSLFVTVRLPGERKHSTTWSAPLLVDAQRDVGASPPSRDGSIWRGAWIAAGVVLVAVAGMLGGSRRQRTVAIGVAASLWSACWLFVSSVLRLLA